MPPAWHSTSGRSPGSGSDGARHAGGMPDAAALLAAYDAQLRGPVEVVNALRVSEVGPLTIAVHADGRAFLTYRDLGGRDAAGIRALVAEAVALLERDPVVREAEWKTRGHDRAPGLTAALTEAGFVAAEPESIMIGEASLLATEVPLPEG